MWAGMPCPTSSVASSSEKLLQLQKTIHKGGQISAHGVSGDASASAQ